MSMKISLVYWNIRRPGTWKWMERGQAVRDTGEELVEARSSRALRIWNKVWFLFWVQEQATDGFQWISKLIPALL